MQTKKQNQTKTTFFVSLIKKLPKLFAIIQFRQYINGSEHWRLVIIAEPKTIHFDLPKDVGDNLKHEIDFVIKHNELLTERTCNKKISRL